MTRIYFHRLATPAASRWQILQGMIASAVAQG
jgi:hypothetical protein